MAAPENGKVMQLKGDLDEQNVGIKKAISSSKCPFFYIDLCNFLNYTWVKISLDYSEGLTADIPILFLNLEFELYS